MRIIGRGLICCVLSTFQVEFLFGRKVKHNVACWHFCFEVPPCSGRDRYVFPSLVLFLCDYLKRIGHAPHPSAFQQDSLLDAQSREHAFEIPQSSLDVRCQNVMPTHVE